MDHPIHRRIEDKQWSFHVFELFGACQSSVCYVYHSMEDVRRFVKY